jgi:site-specific DNA-adenine methylase
MKNHFFFPYAGNKRNEIPFIYDNIKDKLNNIDTIIEPFCGTSACSFYISLKNPKKYKYILNDNNKFLIDLYNICKDDEKLDKFTVDLNKKVKNLNKEEYDKIAKENNLLSWFIINKIYCIRPGMYRLNYKPKEYNLKECPIYNFIKNENIEFKNLDAVKIIEEYKNNENSLIILDPPYMQLCNDFYLDASVNIYEYLLHNNINNMKSKIILILEKIWIVQLLFKDNNFIEYDKTYETTKKKTKHILITNFNL